jgi:hypothetical protein
VERKRETAQAELSDDIILRILKMRPEAERYIKGRSRQKERQTAAAAASALIHENFEQESKIE